MKTAKLVVVLTWLPFLFIPQVSSIPVAIRGIRMPNRVNNFVKGFKSGTKWYDRAEKANDIIQKFASILQPSGTEEAPSLDDLNFYSMEFSVGNPPQQVTALFSISSVITWASSYPSSSVNTAACCAFTGLAWADICCGTQCQTPSCPSDSNGYVILYDTFTFTSVGSFQGFIEVSGGGSSSSPIGVISFSNSPFSVVNYISNKIFSYFLSYQSKNNSSITFGDSGSSAPGISSTPLLFYRDFPHLYFVGLSQISVGNIDPVKVESDLPFRVVLDTIIPATLLAEPAYGIVKSAIVDKMGQPFGKDVFEICYSSSPAWPSLTLSFSNNNGNAAQMILRKENYVVAIDASTECVAILPTSSQGFSVIGSMAQLDRQMIFDVGNSMLYFDSSPDIELTSTTGSSGDNSPAEIGSSSNYAKPIVGSKLFAVYLILLLVCW